MCDVWYLINGNCAQHTPAPWFDNVRLYRFKSDGPQWYVRDLDLFQDNFPEQEFVLESYVRADAANDINTNDNPIIRPGDSIVVDCSSDLGGGIAADPGGGPAVYMHVKCTYIGPVPTKPKLFGPSLQGTYGSYKSDDGTWTIIQADTARTPGGIQRDRYMFDLNDSLFTRGYQIDYYFMARNVAGIESAMPKWCRYYGPYYEFTCLPTKNSEVLFVDDFTGRGSFAGSVENYWTPTFHIALAPPNNWVDRYDVNGPTSGVSNGPGSRAKTKQLVDQYRAVIWDCGDLESITISDGTVNSDKSNDCKMLIDWFEQSEHVCGLWVCGDDVAFDLDGLASTASLTLMSTWCGVDFVATSYFDETGGRTGGGIVSPLLTGETDAGIFVHCRRSRQVLRVRRMPGHQPVRRSREDGERQVRSRLSRVQRDEPPCGHRVLDAEPGRIQREHDVVRIQHAVRQGRRSFRAYRPFRDGEERVRLDAVRDEYRVLLSPSAEVPRSTSSPRTSRTPSTRRRRSSST